MEGTGAEDEDSCGDQDQPNLDEEVFGTQGYSHRERQQHVIARTTSDREYAEK